MRILFVARGKEDSKVSPTIFNQGRSLQQQGLQLDYFPIIGNGIRAYLSAIIKLRTILKKHRYNCIHAHYALSGLVATFAGAKPLIVSLMGSDIYEFRWVRALTKVLSKRCWSGTIVKSPEMKTYLRLKHVHVIPNGVDLSKFREMSKEEVLGKLPLFSKPLIIFIGDPQRVEKNHKLALEALGKLNENEFDFQTLSGIDHELIPYYMNAASLLLLTSLWEGSPNVIKEAMACNLPIVTVDTGDVRKIIGDTEGCYITSYEADEIAEKINLILESRARTTGRRRVQPLSSMNVALKIISVYNKVSKSI